MRNVLTAAKALADTLEDSPEYREYIAAREILRSAPDMAKQVETYERDHMEYQTRRASKNINEPDTERLLSVRYSDLMLNKKTRNFLEAEGQLLDLINQVNGILENVYEKILNISI